MKATTIRVRLSDHTIGRAHLVGLVEEWLGALTEVSIDGKVLSFSFGVNGAANAAALVKVLDTTFTKHPPVPPPKTKGNDQPPYDHDL